MKENLKNDLKENLEKDSKENLGKDSKESLNEDLIILDRTTKDYIPSSTDEYNNVIDLDETTVDQAMKIINDKICINSKNSYYNKVLFIYSIQNVDITHKLKLITTLTGEPIISVLGITLAQRGIATETVKPLVDYLDHLAPSV